MSVPEAASASASLADTGPAQEPTARASTSQRRARCCSLQAAQKVPEKATWDGRCAKKQCDPLPPSQVMVAVVVLARRL